MGCPSAAEPLTPVLGQALGIPQALRNLALQPRAHPVASNQDPALLLTLGRGRCGHSAEGGQRYLARLLADVMVSCLVQPRPTWLLSHHSWVWEDGRW